MSPIRPLPNLKLTSRMALLIALLTVPLFITAIGGYYIYGQIQSAQQDAADETIDEFIPLVKLHIALLKVQIPANDYLVHGNTDEQQEYGKLRANTIKAFDQALNAPFKDHQIMQINEVQKLWTQIDLTSRQLLISENPVNNQKLTLKLEELNSLVVQATQIIESIYIYTLEEIEEELAKTQITTKLFNTGGLIVLLIAILLSLVSIYLLKKYITQPIKDLVTGARLFANGDLSKNIHIHQNDELGHLANTLNIMANKLSTSIDIDKKRTHDLDLANKKLTKESINHKKNSQSNETFHAGN